MEKIISNFKEGNSKRQIENLVIFIALLIIVIIVINNLFTNQEHEESVQNITQVVSDEITNDDLESKLKNILSCMSGVGKTEVMISYSNTIEQAPMVDAKENITIIEEEDVNGGKRKTKENVTEQNIIYEEKNNTKVPAIRQTIMPKVIGVIVVAEGANNSVVKENIKDAVEAVIDIPSHRIQVFAK